MLSFGEELILTSFWSLLLSVTYWKRKTIRADPTQSGHYVQHF
eukprot:SAG31_NODE_2165_length_6281_cov_2.028308_7_plen_43_part_00